MNYYKNLAGQAGPHAYHVAIKAFVTKYWLSPNGIEDDKNRANEADFLNYENAYWACRSMLLPVRNIQTTSRKSPDSYWLKHLVERWTRMEGHYAYIPNGVLILAALAEGFTMTPVNINCLFNMSLRQIKAISDKCGNAGC